MASDGEIPKLSVRLMTFNHSPFIVQALEGCIMQETDFKFDIIIGDDFSTDGTLEICKSYEEQYPDKITLLKRELNGKYHRKRMENGRLYNFLDILNHCNGEYIALLDGDDFWTNPKKLQLQVDFLELNKDYSICHHRVDRLLSDGVVERWDYTNHPISDIYDLAEGNHISTPSCVYRKSKEALPSIFLDSPIGDYIIHFINAEHGKIKFLDKTMALYRENVGIWSVHSKNEQNLKMLETINILKNIYKSDQKLLYKLNKQAALINLQLARFFLDDNDEDSAVIHQKKALTLDKETNEFFYMVKYFNDYFIRKELKYYYINKLKNKIRRVLLK